MKKVLLKLCLFFSLLLVLSLFLYYIFSPIYIANSIFFPFAITPFDIAKVYPKIWIFIKKIYFILMFISYSIIFNYIYNIFQKYIKLNQSNKNKRNINNFNKNILNLLIGKNSNRSKYLFKRIWFISKYTYHRNYW